MLEDLVLLLIILNGKDYNTGTAYTPLSCGRLGPITQMAYTCTVPFGI